MECPDLRADFNNPILSHIVLKVNIQNYKKADKNTNLLKLRKPFQVTEKTKKDFPKT